MRALAYVLITLLAGGIVLATVTVVLPLFTPGYLASQAVRVSAGRLAVLPGTHALPLELPGVVNPLLISFLRGTTPAAALEFLPTE